MLLSLRLILRARKLILLLLDNAGWHVSKHLQLPDSLILYRIPAYTPELSPAEPIMPLLHESLANKTLTTTRAS